MKMNKEKIRQIVIKVLSMYKDKEYWDDLYYEESPNIDKMASKIIEGLKI